MNDRVATPNEQVTGVIDNPEDLPAAAQALESAGFPQAAVVFIGGEERLH